MDKLFLSKKQITEDDFLAAINKARRRKNHDNITPEDAIPFLQERGIRQEGLTKKLLEEVAEAMNSREPNTGSPINNKGYAKEYRRKLAKENTITVESPLFESQPPRKRSINNLSDIPGLDVNVATQANTGRMGEDNTNQAITNPNVIIPKSLKNKILDNLGLIIVFVILLIVFIIRLFAFNPDCSSISQISDDKIDSLRNSISVEEDNDKKDIILAYNSITTFKSAILNDASFPVGQQKFIIDNLNTITSDFENILSEIESVNYVLSAITSLNDEHIRYNNLSQQANNRGIICPGLSKITQIN